MRTFFRILFAAIGDFFKSAAQTFATAFLTLACSHEPKIIRPSNTRWHKFLVDNHFKSSERVQFVVEPEANTLCVCVTDKDGGEHSMRFGIIEDGPEPLHFVAEEVGTNHRFKNEAHLFDFLTRMIARPQLIDGTIVMHV